MFQRWTAGRAAKAEVSPRPAARTAAGVSFSLIMPVRAQDVDLLGPAIRSVRDQRHAVWSLCIVPCDALGPAAEAKLQSALADPRVRVRRLEAGGGIAPACNLALEQADGEWLVTLDADGRLAPDALLALAEEAVRHPSAAVIYTDEVRVEPDGARRPLYKPDFSIELMRAQGYLGRLTAMRAADVRAVGGWREAADGAEEYDLLLRLIERVGGEGVRHVARDLHEGPSRPPATGALLARTDALEGHLRRLGLRGHVEKTPGAPHLRVRLDLPEPAPKVSIIIPTRDRADLVEACAGSILRRTDHPDYEVLIVDNGSVEPATHALFDVLERDSRVRVLAHDIAFNYAALNNFAVARTQAPLVCLLNNDVEVISPGWLTEMASWTVQPDVGCVGAKLLYPHGTIQHGGVVLGIGGVAAHSHKHLPAETRGYMDRLMVVQDLSAVTAACLLVRRDIYLAVGGLDADNLGVAFNDVDFCLKVRRAGYRNVFTPHARLIHHENVSRGADIDPVRVARLNTEIDWMKRTWGAALDVDPFYSPHLTLEREDFTPR